MARKEETIESVNTQMDAFSKDLSALTLDEMSKAPKLETEQQTKLSQSELQKDNSVYLKPKTNIGCKEKFNEKFRDAYNFDKEYVNFVAENKEIIGESINLWTRPYPGVPAQEWMVPVNTPVWGPRFLAEQLKKCSYHRIIMDNQTTGADGRAQYYGAVQVTNTIQRLDAHPVSSRKSVFMGSKGF